MLRGWPVMSGVPAMGHVTAGGHWHPSSLENCSRCSEPKAPPPAVQSERGD